MPIEGRNLQEAARRFCRYLNRLLARIITQTRLIPITVGQDVQIAFRQQGQVVEAPLKTAFGRLNLYIGQLCGSTVTKRKHRLFTASYRYALTPEGVQEPIWRWEYVRKWPDDNEYWCRHHLQGDVLVNIHGQPLSLNDIHLPTGYTSIEEVIRFCIVDLEVKPLSEAWHEILEQSYREFKDVFTHR